MHMHNRLARASEKHTQPRPQLCAHTDMCEKNTRGDAGDPSTCRETVIVNLPTMWFHTVKTRSNTGCARGVAEAPRARGEARRALG